MARHEPGDARRPRRRSVVQVAAAVAAAVLVLAAAGCANDAMHRPVRETAASVRMHGLHDGTDRGMSGSGMYGLIAHTRGRDEPAFLRSMVSHHEEAVEFARELRRSERPSMRRLGQRIAMTKTREIRLMRSWPEAWYPRTPAADESSMMRDLSPLNPHLNRDDLERTFLRD